MTASYKPEITEITDGASANRLILRINTIVNGESVPDGGGRSLAQVVVEGIIGSPEGRSIGSPGDIRVRQDVPQIWQKSSGFRTRTGWLLIAAGGGQGVEVELNGVPVGSGSVLNFIGNVSVSEDVVNNRVDITIPTWQEVYRLDVASLPDADLNAPGASVMIDGVRWRTFAAAATGQNMVVASGSFGLVQGEGLRVVGANNSRVNATTMNGNFIYTSLAELAANNATPFAGDPHAEYMFQVRITNQVADQTTEWSGVMICRFVNTVAESGGLFGNATTWRCGIGFFDGVANRVLGTGGPNPAPPVVYYNPLNLTPPLPATDVPYIQYTSPQSVQFGSYASENDDFVEPGSTYQGYVTSRDATDHEVDIVLHPVYGFFIGFGHCAETLAGNYASTIADFRVLAK